MRRVSGGYGQIAACQRLPLVRGAWMKLEQVGNCQAGPQGRAMAAIKQEQGVRRILIETVHDAAAQVLTSPSDAQPFALETEEGDFIQRVASAEPIIELEAVDDTDRISEPDVLRTQIPMSINNALAQHAIN